MKYIKKVILKNFQSHKYTVIEFDNQLNVIVGPSDSGKTAILRGIRWALYNEPSGDYFIREGESESSVTIIFNNGIKIVRFRSKSKNTFTLYDLDGNETVFEGFGTKIPEEILDLTEINKILLDRDVSKSINLSDQLEGAFLLSERPSVRSNSIGRLVGVNIIDDALRETLRDSRNLSASKRNIEEQIEESKKELSQYEYLDKLTLRYEKIELIKNEISKKENMLNVYRDLLHKLSIIDKEKLETIQTLKNLDFIDQLAYKINNIHEGIINYNYYKMKYNSLKKLLRDKEYNTSLVYSFRDINRAANNIDRINLLSKKIIDLSNYSSKLKSLKNEIKELNTISIRLGHLSLVDSNLNSIKNNLSKLHNLKIINEKKSSVEKSIAIGEKYTERLSNLKQLQLIFDKLRSNTKLTVELGQYLRKLSPIVGEKENLGSSIARYKDLIETNIKQYKELLRKQEVCPLCFSTIDEDKIQHIIEHYD
ncbi:MAG: AAA family ATPase [Tissierellaceae bacterium]